MTENNYNKKNINYHKNDCDVSYNNSCNNSKEIINNDNNFKKVTYTNNAVKVSKSNKEKSDALKEYWKSEEDMAHIHGWDFSHIKGRYTEEDDLPWRYIETVNKYRKADDNMLDIDTGGGEVLLSLKHPYNKTSATEGFPPNVELCRKTLLPLGINFKEADDYSALPFDDEEFDLVINRHGEFNPKEIHRILKSGGLFITQQVGEDNDRELVNLLLPGEPKPFSGLNLKDQSRSFQNAGFDILEGEEAFCPIRFFDVGALVWFARIIEWEFPRFSVERCYNELLQAQRLLETKGSIDGTIHRYLIVAKKNNQSAIVH